VRRAHTSIGRGAPTVCRVCFNPMHPECSALKEQSMKIWFPCWHKTRHNNNNNNNNNDVIVTPRRPPLDNRTNNKNANNNVRFETPALFRPGGFVAIDSQKNPVWICGHSHTPGGTAEYSARYAIDNRATPRVSLSRLETASFEPLSRQASSQEGVVGPS
jgi:hypothetical protein